MPFVPRQGLVEVAGVFQRWAVDDRSASARVSQYWADAIACDPHLRQAVFVVELVFGGALGGKALRVATEPVSQVRADGRRFDALGVIIDQPEIRQDYNFGAGTSSVRSISMTLPAHLVDPAALIAAGQVLDGVAEVSLQLRGRDRPYEDRLVLMRGDITGGVRFGAALSRPGSRRGPEMGQIVDLEISDPKEGLSTKLPPWVADDTRFTSLAPEWVGQRVPLVLNRFEGVPALRVTDVPVGGNTWVFTFGNDTRWSVPLVGGVFVNGIARSNVDASYAWTQATITDAKNDTHAAIVFSIGGTVWGDNDVVHVVADPAQEASLLPVTEVIREALCRYSGFGRPGLNGSLFDEALARFGNSDHPQVLVNAASGKNASTVISWVESGFLKSFPMVSMVWREGRYGPIVTDFRTPPSARWTVGHAPLIERQGLVQSTPKEQLHNEYVYRYDWDPISDVYTKVIVVGADTSALCRMSRDLVGERHAEPIESKYVVDDGLARYVVDWKIAHCSLPSYLVEYVATTQVYLERRLGEAIALTDPEFGWTDRPATIRRMRLMRGRCLVQLQVWERFVDLDGGAFSYPSRV